jgi:hypothetical protein
MVGPQEAAGQLFEVRVAEDRRLLDPADKPGRAGLPASVGAQELGRGQRVRRAILVVAPEELDRLAVVVRRGPLIDQEDPPQPIAVSSPMDGDEIGQPIEPRRSSTPGADATTSTKGPATSPTAWTRAVGSLLSVGSASHRGERTPMRRSEPGGGVIVCPAIDADRSAKSRDRVCPNDDPSVNGTESSVSREEIGVDTVRVCARMLRSPYC